MNRFEEAVRQFFYERRVALNGVELLSHGSDARGVRDAARAKGVQTSLMVHIPDEPNLPLAFQV